MAQLHTIISRELIKPLSPTPSRLRTYNLSLLDQSLPHHYLPMILFYPNNQNGNLTPDDKARELKKSLSLTLTKYYPFAGRLPTPTSRYVDCNDEGVLVIEAKRESQITMKEFVQLFADGMVLHNSPGNPTLVGVQINHFACGGIAVAVSMSHRIGDARTLSSFLHHWALVARFKSIDHDQVLAINPHFIQSPNTICYNPRQLSASNQRCDNSVARKFVFSNSKLSDLKNKVLAEDGSKLIYNNNNPTRVEVLISLIYKTMIGVTTKRLSCFKPFYLIVPANIRDKLVPKLPQTTVGNFTANMWFVTRSTSEASLSVIVSRIKEEKRKLEGVQSQELAIQYTESVFSSLKNEDLEDIVDRVCVCTSTCGFAYDKVDFGWGKSISASHEDFVYPERLDRTGCYMLDTPDGDGIQAWVVMRKQYMEMFENDEELLLFCQTN